MFKRITSLLLALVMILGVTACGKETTPTDEQPKDGEKKTLTIGVQQNINVSDYENNALTKYLEDRMNINIDFKVFDSINANRKTQMNAMIAGGEELPDILFRCYLSKDDQAYYGEGDYLVDLAPYFDNYEQWDLAQKYDWGTKMYEWNKNDPASVETVLYSYRTPEGNMYAWPSKTAGDIFDPPTQMYINKVWLDKLGLEMPRDWDSLFEVLRAFRDKDPNGNGIADEIPMIGFATHLYGNIPMWTVNSLAEVYWNENSFFSVTDEGEVYLPYVQDGYREGLRICNQLVEEGLMAPLSYTITKDEIKSVLTPATGIPVAGIISGHPSVHMDTDTTDVLMQYEVLPPFEDAFVGRGDGQGSRYYFITTDCDDFDLAAEFLFQFCGIPEVYYAANYGQEGVDWEWCTDYDTGLRLPHILNDQAYSGVTSTTWGISGPVYAWYGEGSPFQEGDPNPPSDVYDMAAHLDRLKQDRSDLYTAAAERNNPYHGSYTPDFTAEEIEANGDSQAELKLFFQEQRALFAVGQMDIDDDQVWADYIAKANSLGMETLLKNAQAAYDRTYKK